MLLVVTSLSAGVGLVFPAWALVISVFLLVRGYRKPAQLIQTAQISWSGRFSWSGP